MAGENQFGPWTLSTTEKARLDDYTKLQDMLANDAEKYDLLYQRDKRENTGSNTPLPQLRINIPGLVARAAADLILPKTPMVKSDDGNKEIQTRIDALLKRSKVYRTSWRALYWTSGQGDAFLVIADQLQADGKTSLPVMTLRRATGSVARNVRPEDAPSSRAFIFRSQLGDLELYREYVAGAIRTYAFKAGNTAALPQGYTPSVETKESIPLAIHLAALRGDADDEAFGESDSAGTDDLAFEISNRLRQVSRILDRHAEPPMNVPDGMLDEKGAMDARKVKIFERGADGSGAEYIVWQSQLTEAYAEIDKLMDLICLLTETPGALWGRNGEGLIESGRALKFRLLSGLGKARRTGNMFREGLAEAVVLALRREDILSGRKPGEYSVTVTLSDTFIADELETVERVTQLRQGGVISVQNAVEQGQGLSGDDAAAEVQRIQAEQPAPAPTGLEPGRFTGA